MLNAIDVRNRVTHPKSGDDLLLSKPQVDLCVKAMFWFLHETTQVMSVSNLALKGYLGKLDDVFEKLKAGDPATVALYEATVRGDLDSD